LKNEALRLERTARKVAFGKPRRADIRAAVRDLALTALRSRLLTPIHLVPVAIAVANGLDPETATARSPTSHARAREGLCDALFPALRALELATRAYAARGGYLSHAEVESWTAALDAMPSIGDPRVAEQVGALRKSIGAAGNGRSSEGGYELGLLASGALLGILGH
jgi:hypothetical protein